MEPRVVVENSFTKAFDHFIGYIRSNCMKPGFPCPRDKPKEQRNEVLKRDVTISNIKNAEDTNPTLTHTEVLPDNTNRINEIEGSLQLPCHSTPVKTAKRNLTELRAVLAEQDNLSLIEPEGHIPEPELQRPMENPMNILAIPEPEIIDEEAQPSNMISMEEERLKKQEELVMYFHYIILHKNILSFELVSSLMYVRLCI